MLVWSSCSAGGDDGIAPGENPIGDTRKGMQAKPGLWVLDGKRETCFVTGVDSKLGR